MPVAMLFLRWSASPERTISMRLILMCLPKTNGQPNGPDDWRPSKRQVTNGHAGQGGAVAAPDMNTRRSAPHAPPPPPILRPDLSAVQRDRLLGELVALQSADDAAAWAHLSLPAK